MKYVAGAPFGIQLLVLPAIPAPKNWVLDHVEGQGPSHWLRNLNGVTLTLSRAGLGVEIVRWLTRSIDLLYSDFYSDGHLRARITELGEFYA